MFCCEKAFLNFLHLGVRLNEDDALLLNHNVMIQDATVLLMYLPTYQEYQS